MFYRIFCCFFKIPASLEFLAPSSFEVESTTRAQQPVRLVRASDSFFYCGDGCIQELRLSPYVPRIVPFCTPKTYNQLLRFPQERKSELTTCRGGCTRNSPCVKNEQKINNRILKIFHGPVNRLRVITVRYSITCDVSVRLHLREHTRTHTYVKFFAYQS